MLLDLQMPKLNGIDVLEVLRKQGASLPSPKVIALTTFDTDEQLLSCARLGAHGYLLKDVSLEQLASAITRVVNGELLIQPTITERVIRGLKNHSLGFYSATESETLTPRELEVMRYLAGGYSNREIALAVHLSEGTVKNHVSAILAKLGVRDRTRAVLKAIDLGLAQLTSSLARLSRRPGHSTAAPAPDVLLSFRIFPAKNSSM